MKSTIHHHLLPWIWKALRPIVSLLIRNSISHRFLCLELKRIYVDVAAAEYGKGGRPTNTSRIALLTGLDRKDIKRLRDVLDEHPPFGVEPASSTTTNTQSNSAGSSQSGALGRVLSAWYQDPDYSSEGQPRALSKSTGFVELCKQYGGDITHTAILTELLRVKAVDTLPDGNLIAISRYYMPAKADQEAIKRSFDVYCDVGATLLHNLYRDETEASRFEGRASHAEVPQTRIDDFYAFVETRGQQFLEAVDTELSAYQTQRQPDEQTVRLGLGMYWIQNNQEYGS